MNKMIIFMNHFRSNRRKSRFYIEFFDLKVEFWGFHGKFLSFHEKFWIFMRIFKFKESLTDLHDQMIIFMNHFRSNTRKSRFYIEIFNLKVEFWGFHGKFFSFHEKFWIFKRTFELKESLTDLHEQNDNFHESLSK